MHLRLALAIALSIQLPFSLRANAQLESPPPSPQPQPYEVPAFLHDPQPGVLHLRVGDIHTADLPNLLHPNALPQQPHIKLPANNLQPPAAATRYIIQFDSPLTPQRRELIAAHHITLHDYLPTHAYIASLTDTPLLIAQQLRARAPFVIAICEYQPAWKIDPELARPASTFITPERQQLAAANQLLLDVTLFHDADVASTRDRIADLEGVHILGSHEQPCAWSDAPLNFTTLVVQAPVAMLPTLAAMSDVQYLEHSPEVTLRSNTNTRWIVQTNVTNVTPLYTAGIRGENQLVAVIDGRVNVNHCSFRDTGNPIGNNHRKIQAYNTSTGYDSHGTHVAGTVLGDNGVNDNTRGIAYAARLIFNTIPGVFSEANIFNLLSTHHTQGARSHTNSWGNDGTNAYDGLARGIDNFCWQFEDSMVCFAITNTASLRNPENAKNLLAVGATGGSGAQQNHCSGGSGPTNDQRRKPEIYAPGCNTISSTGGLTTSCTTVGESGTSMASPVIGALGALVRQYYTAGYHPSGAANPSDAFTPTGALMKATLLNSAVDLTGVAGYPSNLEGWGRVLADDALSFTGEARKLIVRDVRRTSPGALSTGAVVEIPFSVTSNAQKLKVTLAWTEPPASAGANPAFTNNLDLEIVAPGNVLYLGNVFTGGVSSTGGTADIRNNVEQVHLNAPTTGEWIARVRATNVAVGPQGYSLVISGAVTEAPLPPPAPANDNCADALLKFAGSHAFTSIGATTDGPDEPPACSVGGSTQLQNDVWYKYFAQCDGTATVSLCGADFNTKLAVYAGCPVGSGTSLTCNDNFCGLASEVSFPVAASTLYFIRIGGFNGATGSGTMEITCTPTPPPPSCPADIAPDGGDGVVGVPDLLAVISGWGCTGAPGECVADIAPEGGDGAVGVPDLLAAISAWGACPE